MRQSNNNPVLEVRDLCKRYPHFYLDDVSFSLRRGTITGFIGRNGAGKTTTLSCLLDLVHPDSGSVLFFGKPYASDPVGVRQQVGFATGTTAFYPHKTLAVLTSVTRCFYKDWDEGMYSRLMDRFELEPTKTPDELSSGMKVKYSIATALSHRADLLILDEPTSGLDPASRVDLLEVFLELVENDGVTILFSTQITSDLEDYADDILFIRDGRIFADASLADFLGRYRLLYTKKQPESACVIGSRRIRTGWVSLINADIVPADGRVTAANLSDVMVLLGQNDKEA